MFESDARFADWLDWFIGEREQIASPFRLPDGRRCATDSKIAVVTTDEGHSAIIEGDWYAKIPERTQSFFSLPVDKEETVENMAERFGECEHPTVQKCSTCKGRKTIDHVCGCDLC